MPDVHLIKYPHQGNMNGGKTMSTNVIKRTADQWRELIAECEASGQNQADWCISRGINLYTYRDRASRFRKLAQQETASKTKPSKKKPERSAWVEIKSESVPTLPNAIQNAEKSTEDGQAGRLIIETGALRITTDAVFSAATLAVLLRELVRSC